MATITIENVPESIINTYGSKINYNAINVFFVSKESGGNRLKGMSKEDIEDNFYDVENDIFGPFKGEENTTFLKSYIK